MTAIDRVPVILNIIAVVYPEYFRTGEVGNIK